MASNRVTRAPVSSLNGLGKIPSSKVFALQLPLAGSRWSAPRSAPVCSIPLQPKPPETIVGTSRTASGVIERLGVFRFIGPSAVNLVIFNPSKYLQSSTFQSSTVCESFNR
jgi:hypothetical protein